MTDSFTFHTADNSIENNIFLQRLVLGFSLSVLAIPAGEDLIVIIRGGCAPHVGSVSVARSTAARNPPAETWGPSPGAADCPAETGSQTAGAGNLPVETILLPGHRDDVIGESFARELAGAAGKTVSVNCGIHYANPSRQEIGVIVQSAQSMLFELIQLLSR